MTLPSWAIRIVALHTRTGARPPCSRLIVMRPRLVGMGLADPAPDDNDGSWRGRQVASCHPFSSRICRSAVARSSSTLMSNRSTWLCRRSFALSGFQVDAEFGAGNVAVRGRRRRFCAGPCIRQNSGAVQGPLQAFHPTGGSQRYSPQDTSISRCVHGCTKRMVGVLRRAGRREGVHAAADAARLITIYR